MKRFEHHRLSRFAASVLWCALLLASIPAYVAGRTSAPRRAYRRALQPGATVLLYGSLLLLFERALPGDALRVTPADAAFGARSCALCVTAGLARILLRVAIEERLLAAELADAHAAYRERTRKRTLVPGIW